MTPRRPPPTPTPLGDTNLYTPSADRPVRVRARTLQVDTHFEPHRHPWAQLAYCSSGVVQVTAAADGAHGEITYIVPPTRAVWIAPRALHHVTVLEAAEFRTLYIDESAVPSEWTGCRVMTVSALLREAVAALDAAGHAVSDHALAKASRAASTPPSPAPLAQLLARESLLTRLVQDELEHADVQAHGVPVPSAMSGDKRLRALCEAVMREPARRATLTEWASDMGASERTMARLFRDELGTTYQQWRQQAVLAHALPLLARGKPVSQVAEATGYASDSAFSAMFKAAMGQPPSAFQVRAPPFSGR